MKLAVLWLIAMTVVSTALAQAPPNDLFINGTLLSGTSLTVPGSTTNATKELGEPDHTANPGGRSVWWRWTAPANGDLVIHTDGSDFDTLLAAYTGATVSGLSLVASNDDHGIVGTSRVRFQVTANQQYQIAVDGFNDGTNTASGVVSLTLSFISEPIARPANDHFQNRILLTGAFPAVSASNSHATRQAEEPLHAGREGDTSVWWTWTAPSSQAVRISTGGSGFDTLLAVYTGTSLSDLTVVASNDDEDPFNAILTSAVTFETIAGTTYQIAVDGFDGASGHTSLVFSSAATRLSGPMRLPDGRFRFTLIGLPERTNEIHISSNLLDWTTLATVVNANGSLIIIDDQATNLVQRFYRARLIVP